VWETRDPYEILIGKSLVKRPHRKPGTECEDNINVHFAIIGCENERWLDLLHDVHWVPLILAVLNLRLKLQKNESSVVM